MTKILVIGSCGQIGTELVLALRTKFGNQAVVAADLRDTCPEILQDGPYIKLDALDREQVRAYVIEQKIEQVYLLAALLSATAEKNPDFAWKLNMEGLSWTSLKKATSKKYFGRALLPYLAPLPQPIKRHSIQSWSPQRCTAFLNKPASAGVNTTTINLASMFAAYAILASFHTKAYLAVAPPITRLIFSTKQNLKGSLPVF
jgi:hypothetical protein